MGSSPHIMPGKYKQLGLINWVIARLGARRQGVPDAHLLSTLARGAGLFRGWFHLYTRLMMFGSMSSYDQEVAILRLAHLRSCAYELEHHRIIGRKAGIDDELQARVIEGPDAAGLGARERAIITAVDAFVLNRRIDDTAWKGLAEFYSESQLLEFCLLAGFYDSLAATIESIGIESDFN
ncbi:4-carboxymuconolactone decarboxylase [Nocardia gamkensis]|uniref:Carboxymuconolactone decarboxylase family protein n=2 Tax=Nocardia gamkensis TaxID=352869 RepID=A0A7X6KZS7_9NOCA|nr:carboxymuconolactone decarboxylase family protein [Nocardia gamkensis]NKY25098.1 carboxymuconolactone decarboxylase family protein [Nocardia gamkensis]NQE66890.1 4-carboxymuconolactone decarboxylase [Nocardia gamkensis]